jgi:hypothetical protein
MPQHYEDRSQHPVSNIKHPEPSIKRSRRGSSGVEQLIRNQQVVSSNLILGSNNKHFPNLTYHCLINHSDVLV